jgi:hypothetical protein
MTQKRTILQRNYVRNAGNECMWADIAVSSEEEFNPS